MPRFGGTPCNVYKGAPLLGQESDAIMKEILGYSAEKIESLKAARRRRRLPDHQSKTKFN